MLYQDEEKQIRIEARDIIIGSGVRFGANVDINIKGTFEVGDYSTIGRNSSIQGNNIKLGKHFYNSSSLRIGGGGRLHPRANFTCGDRCVVLNSFINVCEPVVIGDDFNLSEDSTILTHGYSLSVLEGYPASFLPVIIGNGVEIGYRSLVLMGVTITDKCVIGAQSIVTKSLNKSGIYVGAPARYIKPITPIDCVNREKTVREMLASYDEIAIYHGVESLTFLNYPWIEMNDFRLNVEDFTYEGKEDEDTDDLRDYIRKWGIRIYTERPFASKLK